MPAPDRSLRRGPTTRIRHTAVTAQRPRPFSHPHSIPRRHRFVTPNEEQTALHIQGCGRRDSRAHSGRRFAPVSHTSSGRARHRARRRRPRLTGHASASAPCPCPVAGREHSTRQGTIPVRGVARRMPGSAGAAGQYQPHRPMCRRPLHDGRSFLRHLPSEHSRVLIGKERSWEGSQAMSKPRGRHTEVRKGRATAQKMSDVATPSLA